MPTPSGFETEAERQARLKAERKKEANEQAQRQAAAAARRAMAAGKDPAVRSLLREYASAKGFSQTEPRFDPDRLEWTIPDSTVKVVAITWQRFNSPPLCLKVRCIGDDCDENIRILGKVLYEKTSIPVDVVREYTKWHGISGYSTSEESTIARFGF